MITEAEYDPTPNVEKEVDERVSLMVRNQTHPIEVVIAVRYPVASAGRQYGEGIRSLLFVVLRCLSKQRPLS